MRSISLDPQTLLMAYAQGAFPMTDPDGSTRWYTANPRGIFPLDQFHVPHSLRPLVNRPIEEGGFEIRVNSDFDAVIRGCRNTRLDGSWISDTIIDAYRKLHELGYAHSVESWRGGKLVGGLYGVSLGGAFFGESMFHYERDASKVALVKLVQRLRERGYDVLDTQASTPHLKRFGCVEIPAREYLKRLQQALALDCKFA